MANPLYPFSTAEGVAREYQTAALLDDTETMERLNTLNFRPSGELSRNELPEVRTGGMPALMLTVALTLFFFNPFVGGAALIVASLMNKT